MQRKADMKSEWYWESKRKWKSNKNNSKSKTKDERKKHKIENNENYIKMWKDEMIKSQI